MLGVFCILAVVIVAAGWGWALLKAMLEEDKR